MHPQPPANNAMKRKLTISSKYFPRIKKGFAIFPAIRLSGKWLEQAGFEGGQLIEVACEKNKLIITILSKCQGELVEPGLPEFSPPSTGSG
jgi:toxic protein SymE